MKKIELPLPELFGIAATRGLLGAGVALLLADHMERKTRRLVGLALATIGVVSTAPFARDVFRHRTHK